MSESKRSETKGGDDEEKEEAGDYFIEELVKFTNTTDYVSKVGN